MTIIKITVLVGNGQKIIYEVGKDDVFMIDYYLGKNITYVVFYEDSQKIVNISKDCPVIVEYGTLNK